jgi:predicted transcriptional regulator
MAEEDLTSEVDLNQVARIISSYVRSHQLGPDQLIELIVAVHHALAALGQAAPPLPEPRKPAVPIRRSVQPDYIVCLECGFRAQTLRRHLRAEHGLSVDEYRARWNLRSDHPLTAPAYSQRRSVVAKEMGLGRRRRAVEPTAAPTRRGRRRRPTTE